MSQTTNEQKQLLMANEPLKQELRLELFKISAYWINYTPPNVAACNLANKKKKDYARYLLEGGGINLQTVANHFVVIYTADPPEIEGGDGSVSTAHVETYAIQTFEFLAGVKPGDDNIPLL